MRYRIRHTTRFDYDQPVRESVMEVRMQPRTDSVQRCLEFDLAVKPEVRSHRYIDFLGNAVHHFDIPGVHDHLEVTATTLVDTTPLPPPPRALSSDAWAALDDLRERGEHWDWLHPSHFARPSDRLGCFMEELGIRRRDDPLSVARELDEALGRSISYARGSTSVDSPIEECLESRKGVCQDFAHVFIAIARCLGIPARYVSGYLHHRLESGAAAEDASHAWVELFIPGAGWIGFDPSNRGIVSDRHVRVAVGRDYQDVPPTRGVFRGVAQTRLSVDVDVAQQ